MSETRNQIVNTPILIFGLGFVGLSCFAGFKKLGLNVYGIDRDLNRVSEIKSLNGFWIEPDIKAFLKGQHNFSDYVSTEIPAELSGERIVCVFCVGTPEKEDGSADTEILYSAITDCLETLENNFIEVVIKSTVPPGTAADLENHLSSQGHLNHAVVVSNPEFLREGFAFEDFNNPDRIVVGANTTDTVYIETIYRSYFKNVFRTNTTSAEFSKYYSNSALAMMISFANDLRLFADHIGDVDNNVVFEQFQRDRRWSDGSMSKYFWPGIGYGGYCLPKDTRALHSRMNDLSYEGKTLHAAINVNDSLIEHFAYEIVNKFIDKERLVLLGSSFKVGSDDIRMSKTIQLVEAIKRRVRKRICLLCDVAAQEIVETTEGVELIDEKHIDNSDGVVIVLRDPKYKDIVAGLPASSVLNIPLL